MLQEKYLPRYHFSEKHSVVISKTPEQIFPLVDQLDFSDAKIVRFLCWLRGMPSEIMTKKGLQQSHFVELEQCPNQELILGLVGQFWKLSGNLQAIEPAEFVAFRTAGFAKASWNFLLTPQANGTTLLETETRILCLDEKTRRRFSRYWFFIRPFSGIIRLQMLRLIRRKAEKTI